jgi:hypothetical protein
MIDIMNIRISARQIRSWTSIWQRNKKNKFLLPDQGLNDMRRAFDTAIYDVYSGKTRSARCTVSALK